MADKNELTDGVLAWREQLRQQAHDTSGQRLLMQVSEQLRSSSLDEVASTISELLQNHLNANSVALLRYSGARLQLVAGTQLRYPDGTRLPSQGWISAMLRYPVQPLCRHGIEATWLARQASAGYEWIIPLVSKSQVTGVLVITGNESAPEPIWQAALAVVSVVLAMAWSDASGLKARHNERHRHDLNTLTAREKEVMALLPQGMSNARIASTLGISLGTVKTHIEHMLAKLQLEDRAQAAARAVELKLGGSGL
ncbi:MAG: LuxR C-terminal-related transcriptional regulator [Paraperlucidibaca sp.]